MAELYRFGDNVVPDLLCYEMLPADNEGQLTESFCSALKFTSSPHHAASGSLQDAGCSDVLPPHLVEFVFENSDPGVSETNSYEDNQTVPSLSGPAEVANHELMSGTTRVQAPPRADQALPWPPRANTPLIITNDCTASFLKVNVNTTAEPMSQEVPQLYADRHMLRKHRENSMSEPMEYGDGPGEGQASIGWLSELHSDGHRCDCDEHLVPRWDVEE